mgnify:CR=1 FL=1
MYSLNIPISEESIRNLHVGDPVRLNGIIMTGRDAAHKWFYETFIHPTHQPTASDQEVYAAIKPFLENGVIYHCGPVVAGGGDEPYRFVAAGPTTSIREEPYQGEVMRHFNLRGVIGKGGMGAATLAACSDVPAVYFHASGGAAALLACAVRRVLGVYKLEFGVPEALWVIEVQDFPVVVTMDAHGRSLHDEIEQQSQEVLNRLLTS